MLGLGYPVTSKSDNLKERHHLMSGALFRCDWCDSRIVQATVPSCPHDASSEAVASKTYKRRKGYLGTGLLMLRLYLAIVPAQLWLYCACHLNRLNRKLSKFGSVIE